MKDMNAPKIALYSLALLAALTLLSCASSPERSRGSLSDAMDKARDDNEGSRGVPDSPSRDDDPWGDDSRDSSRDRGHGRNDDSGGGYGDSGSADAPITLGDGTEGLCFGVRGAWDLASSEPWAAPLDLDLLLGVSGDEGEVVGYAGLRVVDPAETSAFAASIDDSAGILRAGVEFRWFPLPSLEYLSPHIELGLGGFTMMWTYRNALTAGDETIAGDSLGGLHVSAGAGISLARWSRAEFGVRLVTEAYLFGDTTGEGFVNDFFSPLGVVKIAGEVMLR